MIYVINRNKKLINKSNKLIQVVFLNLWQPVTNVTNNKVLK